MIYQMVGISDQALLGERGKGSVEVSGDSRSTCTYLMSDLATHIST